MKASSSDLCYVRVLFRHWTWQDTLSQKLLDMAVKTWDGALKDLDGARKDLDFACQGFREAVQNGDEKERKEAREDFEKAKEEFEKAKEEAKRAQSKVETAKEEAKKAREELEEAKSTAPLQAGRAFALLHVQLLLSVRSVVVRFRALHHFCFLGSCSPLSKDSLVVKLHCFGLQHFGEPEGLLAAAGSGKSGALRVLPRLQNGVSILGSRWAGSACVALALRSPGCGCFCLRLDFQVTVSVRGSQGPGFLMPAFSTRTLKSSGVPGRRVQAGGFCVGMSPLACSTPACPGFLVVVRFRGVHDCCLLGCCFPLSPSSLRCLHCVGLQQSGEREGLSEQRALGCFRFMLI